MTLAELRADVFRRLDSASGAFFSSADVDEALNEGLMELSDETEWFERVARIDLLERRPYYDLRTVFPSDEVLTAGRAFNTQTNVWLDPVSAMDLDAHADPRWERVTGQPSHVFLRGLWWLGYWPMLASETGTIEQYVTALPPLMVKDYDEPTIPRHIQPCLVEYALAVLLPQQGEVTKGLAAWEAYRRLEQALRAQVDERGHVPQRQGLGVPHQYS